MAKRIACVLGQDFEDSEFRVPFDRLQAAGHQVVVIGAKKGEELRGKKGKEKARADISIDDAKVGDFDALLIPGGHSPDNLRRDDRFVRFVGDFDKSGKLIAAVCHGPQLLMAADRVKGRTLTAWKTIQHDLKLAGVDVKDEPLVEDGNWITSRQPGDLDVVSRAFLDCLGEAKEREAVSTPPPA